jgi:hypothetical protein
MPGWLGCDRGGGVQDDDDDPVLSGGPVFGNVACEGLILPLFGPFCWGAMVLDGGGVPLNGGPFEMALLVLCG